jgi:hypothetical protein
MNTIARISVAGALALGGVAANASISQPSTGASDLILFAEVVNSTTGAEVASYAGDTSVLAPAYNGTLTNGVSNVGDTALAALFAADGAGDEIVYSVQGGYVTSTATGKQGKVAGVANFATTSANPSTTGLGGTVGGSMPNFAAILSNTISTLNVNFAGAKSVEGTNPTTSGVWDVNATTGISFWAGFGGPTAVTYGSGPQTLYSVTANVSSTANVLENTLGTVNLTAAGLVFAASGGSGPPPTVPLPPAVWLLGSGLLGLAGIARRKSANS